MPDRAPLLDLLGVLHAEGLLSLDPDTLHRVLALLEARPDWPEGDPEGFAHGMAALLGRDATRVAVIAGRLREWRQGRPVRQRVSRVEADAEEPASTKRTTRLFLGGGVLSVLLGAGLVLSLAIAPAVVAIVTPSVTDLLEEPLVNPAEEIEPKETTATVVSFELAENPKVLTEHTEGPGIWWSKALLQSLLMGLLVSLGVRLITLPRRYAPQRLQRLRRWRREVDPEDEPGPADIRYPVAFRSVLERSNVEQAATLLARRVGSEASTELDLSWTIDATARAAGWLELRFLRARSDHPLLVWLDEERGWPPQREDVLDLVAQWRRFGLRVELYTFRFNPQSGLRHAETHADRSPAELARTRTGAPLLIASRLVELYGHSDRATSWLERLSAWPERALLDLNGDDPASRGIERALERSNTPRFMLSSPGVVATAAHLAGFTMPPPRPVDDGVRGADPALRRWATVAAFVPDPTWCHLRHLARTHVPELVSTLR